MVPLAGTWSAFMDAQQFTAKIKNVHQRVTKLMRDANTLPPQYRELFVQDFAELDTILEELQAAEPDLVEQHRRLEESHEQIKAERQRAEEARDESRRRLQALFDNAQEAILLLDDQAHYVDANPAACVMTGYSHAELLDRTLRDLMVGSGRGRFVEGWRLFLANDLRSGEFSLLHKNGSIVETEYRAAANIVPGLHLAVLRDITKRKRAEEASQLYAERLKILHQIDRAILAARSPLEVARVALDHILQLVPCNRAGVAVIMAVSYELVTLTVDSRGIFRVDTGVQLSSELFGGQQAGSAVKLGSGHGDVLEPLIYAQPPPLVQALLADGVRSYMVLPLVFQGTLIGALSLGAGEDAFTNEHLDIAKEVADSVAIAIQQANLIEQISAGREQLRSLSRRLVEAQETERRRLAQELHDQVGQNLTALSINLNILRGQLPDTLNTKAIARLNESARLIEETTEQIRSVMAALRPAVLDDYGLAAALRWYAQQFATRTGLTVIRQIDGGTTALRVAPEVETALFRVAQEALTNAAKHAGASQVLVGLTSDEQNIRLTVTDDGAGFNMAEQHRNGQHGGLGLIGMRERIEAVGGTVQVESALGEGTRVVAVTPR
jgi:PAS domain S-box-containing protein